MKTIGKINYLFGILMLELMLCSADEVLTEAKLKKIYKLEPATIDAKNYKFIYGETIKEPTKKILMKIEIPAENKTKSYISHEIEVFKDLKKDKKDLLSECIADMHHQGTYEGKKTIIISRLGKNLKEYSSKAYSWDELSKMGPCMIKALRLLHKKHYIHRNLSPESFAFGTEKKQSGKESVPLKNLVYLFDVGHAEKYRHSNGSHKAFISTFCRESTFASLGAMNNRTQSRRDDMESLYFVIAYLAGFTSPFEEKDFKKLHEEKNRFSTIPLHTKTVFEKLKIKDVRILNALVDFQSDLNELFNLADHEKEPEYEDFVKCFNQGLSEEGIKKGYEFVGLKQFEDKSSVSLIGRGNTTDDPNNKMEVVMKLMKTSPDENVNVFRSSTFKNEVRVYNDLKKGMKHSLIRKNVCHMFDHGIYDGRRAIIMPRLGLDWSEYLAENYPQGYPYELLCKGARYAISALRFMHERGYLHRDVKIENFAFGTVDYAKNDKSQADKPLKNRLYLFDFGWATKWRYENKTHKPYVHIGIYVGTFDSICRTGVMQYSQSRRDDMESLLFALAVAAAAHPVFSEESQEEMFADRHEFVTKPGRIEAVFNSLEVTDARVHRAFVDYATQLNKLFKSNAPEYFEKEPDYNAFCACFGGKPGDNACAVDD